MVGEHMENPSFGGLQTTETAGLLVGRQHLICSSQPTSPQTSPGQRGLAAQTVRKHDVSQTFAEIGTSGRKAACASGMSLQSLMVLSN